MRRHHEDADAYVDAITELCRVGYPQSPPELCQELISEQFVRGQSDPELKKYLWVMIRTQKDQKLQTLIEVCTDFANIGQPTTVHRPVEQVFAMEEEEYPEDMVAMVEQLQWTGRGTTEPQMSPSLQQMFALACRMGYEMQPIACRLGVVWHAVVPLSGLPGRCDFIRQVYSEALARLKEVLSHLSDFGLQMKAKKCTFMQTEVVFLGHIVGRTGLACDPAKLSAVRDWHAPDKVKAVRQFVDFVGYYRRFVKDFAELAEPLVALTRKGARFVWTDRQQTSFEALKACLISAPILGFPTEDGRFLLDTDASLFSVGGVLNQLQDGREVVIVYASCSLRLSQRHYCMTRREMLAVVVMCTHFRSYLRGAQFTLRTDHSSLRWLQKFCNEDGMLARWYLLLGQFSVTFEYRPRAQHANADGMSRQCGQCQRPDCPVSSSDSLVAELDTTSALLDQPFASSEMGESMDADLLPELSGETWVVATLLEGLTADLLPAGAGLDLIVASGQDMTLAAVREWVRSGVIPTWTDCAGLSPELRCWRLQIGNLSIDTEGRLWRRRAPPSGASQLVVPHSERRFHNSLFAGHLKVSRTVFRLQNRVYWPGLRQDVKAYLASCNICLARKSPYPWRAPMGHVDVGHGWALGIQQHPDSPILLVHCQDLKKVPQPSGVMPWIEVPRPEGAPTIPVLGASTVASTSQGSPSVDVLPPDEGVVLADVDSMGRTGSLSGSRAACPNMSDVDGSGMDVLLSSLTSAVVPFSSTVIRVDVSCVLHPFSGCGAYTARDDCPYIQLSGGCTAGWCQVGYSGRTFP